MTTPEVPPYSSTTTASCIPPWRSWRSSGSRRSVSGTSTACVISADTGTSHRRSNGTAIAFLTWTMPSMSSQSAPTTGKREWPVRRARATTSAAVAVRSIAVARERGVMTSAAVWSANPRDAVTSRAVLRSRVPASADVRTSEASSAGLRAADSSSWGSMPRARSVRFATPLSRRIIGLAAFPNHRTGVAATFAVASGSDTARVFGTISPTIIEKTVATSIASTDDTDAAADGERPRSSRGPRSSAPIDGLAMKPRTSVVSVMPSWQAESWVDRRRCEVRTDLAPFSPASTARRTAGRSSATSENSAATKSAVPTVRSTPRSRSNHGVIVGSS